MSDTAGTDDDELPLFPLRTVLFPDGLLELRIFETRYLDMVSSCMRTQRPFGVVALQSGTEVKTADAPVSLHDAGTLAELLEVDSVQAGLLSVRARGTRRFVLQSHRQRADGLWVGRVEEKPHDAAVAPTATHARIVESLAEAIGSLAAQDARPFLEPHRLDDAGWVANRWCEILPLPTEAKLRLMMWDDPLARLDVIEAVLRTQAPVH